ncbi:hypothetical protein Lalb_Chr06g0169981 [Lupinus albus]|uniref:Uncharacterized protein n=1 Tax=Lupinus albus TaxID=3870 RepID=A0A6A4QDQ5_LUPAL|nr:hypothetical protein Lalb_Chr06g0169981 [Lupinus albus]
MNQREMDDNNNNWWYNKELRYDEWIPITVSSPRPLPRYKGLIWWLFYLKDKVVDYCNLSNMMFYSKSYTVIYLCIATFNVFDIYYISLI